MRVAGAPDVDALARDVVQGNRRALARTLTILERDVARSVKILEALDVSSAAYVVGVTGPGGTGKSTLVNALVSQARSRDLRVAVLAVDPSSQSSGGAVLGDRIRMAEHTADDGVFIRSISSRGALGGLTRAAMQAIDVVEAAGFELIFVETVGVGQAEVDVACVADSVVVVTAPGLGDAVQALKAGVLEVGDIYVVNKGDRPGVDAALRDLKQLVSMRAPAGARAPVLRTTATEGAGIEALWAALEEKRACVGSRAREVRRDRAFEIAFATLAAERIEALSASATFKAAQAAVVGGAEPWSAADRALGVLGLGGSGS